MRVSVDSEDAGYAKYREIVAMGLSVKISIDGAEVGEAITADDADGTVLRYKTDAAGQPIINGDELERETLHGDVLIWTV